jgi:hypothetical protein
VPRLTEAMSELLAPEEGAAAANPAIALRPRMATKAHAPIVFAFMLFTLRWASRLTVFPSQR